ncbi:hypothetical protein N9980_01570 [bacterium]|nr:hypothetical protein [bacterium]
MARLCAVCRHDERERIEQEIVGGMSLRAAAKNWNLHFTQLQRHMSIHYPMSYVPQQPPYRKLSQSTVGQEIDEVGQELDRMDREEPSALDKVRDLHTRVNRVMECSEKLGNAAEILRAASELRRIVELESRLTGEAEKSPGNREIIFRVRTDFSLPDNHPECFEEYRLTRDREAALPSGEDVVDADFEECEDALH